VVMTYANGEQVRNYIGGQAHGGRPGYEFYFESIEALCQAGNPRNILVIGYGTGSIVEAALRTPGVETVTLVELNGTLMRNLERIPLFQSLLKDQRLKIIIEDGRRFLLRTHEQFDAILIDPLRSTTAYSGNLYSREFFALAKDHLRPYGVFLVYLDEHKILPATLASVFPQVRIHSFFGIGSRSAFQRNEAIRDRFLAGFSAEEQEKIKAYDKSFESDGSEFRGRDLSLNQDMRPIVEYYLGRTIRRVAPAVGLTGIAKAD